MSYIYEKDKPVVYWLPLEPINERYTEQWYRWFPNEFERQGVQYQTVQGNAILDNEIQTGTFLDINSTIAWKSEQIRRLAWLFHEKKIKNGDIIFVADTEMFGMEGTIKYLAQLNGISVSLHGFAHAGSYTREDFVAPCAPFAAAYEQNWQQVFDKIYVGSLYHKQMLGAARGLGEFKIKVTGNPYDIDEVLAGITKHPKINRVIHTNRPDPEKRPLVTLEVFDRLKVKYPDWEFVVCTSRKKWGEGKIRDKAQAMAARGAIKIYEGLTKKFYLDLLATSKVMTGSSIEENFGYCILESLIVDTIPVVEWNYSHPELLQNDERCLYQSSVPDRSQLDLVEKAMLNPFSVKVYAEQYRNSLHNIVADLKRWVNAQNITQV